MGIVQCLQYIMCVNMCIQTMPNVSTQLPYQMSI